MIATVGPFGDRVGLTAKAVAGVVSVTVVLTAHQEAAQAGHKTSPLFFRQVLQKLGYNHKIVGLEIRSGQMGFNCPDKKFQMRKEASRPLDFPGRTVQSVTAAAA